MDNTRFYYSARDYRNFYPEKYDKIFKYTVDNWNELVKRASYQLYKDNAVSVVDQIKQAMGCPYNVASEIAQSVASEIAQSVSISMMID